MLETNDAFSQNTITLDIECCLARCQMEKKVPNPGLVCRKLHDSVLEYPQNKGDDCYEPR